MRSLTADEHDVALSAGVAVLVFRMADSPACQQFQPELDEFVARHPDCAVWTVEAMEQRNLADLHHLQALPSIVVYRDGMPVRRFAGGISADDLDEAVNEVIHADMQEELNAWMLEMLETGEAGSPYVSAPASDARRAEQATSAYLDSPGSTDASARAHPARTTTTTGHR
ncbi:thioredoxin family protein [Micromonospora sp. CB01531]|uniref:thioredoxin family protein n=1 Tax=Micromonospora sp. CB01531 TaxID=1718947 RepID=UPI000AA32D17|nr:thioredoxin family protein [Micromonospora sp. CB01531]